MRINYSGDMDYPKDFSEDEKLEHIALMHDTRAVLNALHDQIGKAYASVNTPEAMENTARTDLRLAAENAGRELRHQIRAAQPWIGATVLADFDLRLHPDVSRECEELIDEYPTYRKLLSDT